MLVAACSEAAQHLVLFEAIRAGVLLMLSIPVEL